MPLLGLILLLVLSQSYGLPAGKNGYTGLRFTVQKSIIEASHYEAYVALANSLASLVWPNMIKSVGSSFFGITFNATNVKTISAKYDASKATASAFTVGDKTWKLNQTGEVLTIAQGFDYDLMFLGMHVLFGKGQAVLATKSLVLVETFADRNVTTTLNADWKASVTVDGWSVFGLLYKWVELALDDHYKLLADKLQTAVTVFLADKLKTWTDIKVIFYPDTTALNVLLKNGVLTMNEEPAGYITIGYQTHFAVEDRLPIDEAVKVINTPVAVTTEKCKVCVSPSILSHMLHLRARTGDFLYPIEPRKIGLVGKLSDLAGVMPRVQEAFDPELEMYVGCQGSKADSILRIKDADLNKERIKVQAPFSCTFGIKKLGIQLLTTYGYLRATVMKTGSSDATSFTMKGKVTTPYVQSVGVTYAAYPVEGMDTLRTIISRAVYLLEGFEVVPPGVTVNVKVGASQVAYQPGALEDCYSYN